MIEVKELSKKYNSFVALNGISFSVNKGEIFGFLGPNGAGKTTTLRILTGQIYPTGGSASVSGFDVVKDRAKLKQNIGVVFEYQNLYPRLSGRLNLDIFRKLYNIPSSRVDEALKMVQLYDRADDAVKNYSRGMKQRLLIARGLIHKPSVIFLDEPTSGLDPHSSREIRYMIKELGREGITIFLTTHYLDEAEFLCHRVAILDKGKIIALDKTEDLKYKYSSQELKVKVRNSEDDARVLTLSMDKDDTASILADCFNKKQVMSIHSVEPTLEEIFLKITNRGNL